MLESGAMKLAESVDYVNDKSGLKDFYQFSDPAPSSNRMFIIENRQYTDFNYYLPEYHVQGNHGGLIFFGNGTVQGATTARFVMEITILMISEIHTGKMVMAVIHFQVFQITGQSR